jgi:hypothetical protein
MSVKHNMPFRKAIPFAAGVVFGLILRVLFWTKPGTMFSAMSGGFIFFMPFAVGAITVYVAERKERRSWSYYFAAPVLATSLVVLGTLVIMLEGLICAIVIIPLFAVMGGLGGLLMGAICRLTNWPKQSMYCLATLPFVAAMLFAQVPIAPQEAEFERSVLIRATPARVWSSIVETPPIKQDQMAHAWAMRIGVPAPERGAIRVENGERLRRSNWGKAVYFDEVISRWEPHHALAWNYRFYPDSFPKHALDDHVEIGGHYFDLIETEFWIEPEGQQVRLHTRTRYRVSTDFNFYANWVAQLVIGDLAEKGLMLFKERSEGAS